MHTSWKNIESNISLLGGQNSLELKPMADSDPQVPKQTTLDQPPADSRPCTSPRKASVSWHDPGWLKRQRMVAF